MKPQELEQMLRQTLTDRKLSGGERSALNQILSEVHLDGQKTATFRAMAFRLASEMVEAPHAREIIGWLEDIVKLLHPIKQSSSEMSSEVLFAPFDDLSARVCRVFQGLKRTADLCVFTITDDRISDSILTAHRRGVTIRIITDNDKAFDLGSDIDRLSDAGIPVRVDRTEAHMHHKFAVFDDALLLNGSYNWTRSATRDNNENFVLTSERMLVDNFAKHFEKLWGLLGG